MASAAATWSPSSPQLHLALNCRNCRKTPSIILRTRVGKLDRQLRALRVAPGGNGGDRSCNGGSWIGSDSKVDTFAGWSKSEGGGGDSIESQRKKWFRGIVGGRVTGIVIVAGLTFATLSLTKRNSSRPKQRVEPLTTQKETLLACLDVDIDTAINNASIREDLQYYLAFDGTPVAPQNIRSLPKLPESEIVGSSFVDSSFKDSDGSIAASKLEKASELKENLINVEPTNQSIPNANPTNFYTDQQDEMPGSIVSSTPIVHDPKDRIAVSVSTSSDLEPTVEPQVLPKDDKDNVIASSIKENLDLSVKPHVSVDGNGSSSEVHKKEIKNSNVLLDFSSTPIVHSPNDPIAVSVSTSSELKPTLEPHVVPTDDKENVISSSIKENLELSKKPYVSLEGSGSSSEVHNLKEIKNSNVPLDFSSTPIVHALNDPIGVSVSTSSELKPTLEPQVVPKGDKDNVISSSIKENLDLSKKSHVSVEGNGSSSEVHNLNEIRSSGTTPISVSPYPFTNEQDTDIQNEMNRNISLVESPKPGNTFSSAGIPAPSVVSAALRVLPGKVLVPSVVDQVQGQALSALQMLKVIESDVQPRDLCTRREYARWLVSASGALSRNSILKVYPAMYIENVTELAYDDITPEDPDFASIQGLAEAGLISSKLSRSAMLASSDEDQNPLYFYPESPLSRQDLVSWKMALEKRQLPEADRKSLFQLSGFLDTGKINQDAYPALVADISAGEQGITALAFGYTRLFQPDKPVTKAQAAIALATGEASDVVSEELARIAAESMAQNDVAAHSALVAQVEKDIKASFEEEVSIKRDKIDAVEKMAEVARRELERLKAEREVDNVALMKERAAVESQMEVHSRLRHELEEKLQSLTRNKVEVSYEMERISKLKKEIENENNKISRLQNELEDERKALSMARARAEGEAKSAREQAKALEEVRKGWERQGIKVVGNNILNNVKVMAGNLRRKTEEKSREKAGILIMKMVSHYLASTLKKSATKARARGVNELKNISISKAKESAQKLQQSTAEFRVAVEGQAKQVAGDWREGVEKFAQKFKK